MVYDHGVRWVEIDYVYWSSALLTIFMTTTLEALRIAIYDHILTNALPVLMIRAHSCSSNGSFDFDGQRRQPLHNQGPNDIF